MVYFLVPRFIYWLGVNAIDLGSVRPEEEPEGTGEQAMMSAPDEEPADPYSTLGVEPGVSKAELRAHYHEQLKLYYPDKVAHLGSGLRAAAHERTLKIKQAFERISST